MFLLFGQTDSKTCHCTYNGLYSLLVTDQKLALLNLVFQLLQHLKFLSGGVSRQNSILAFLGTVPNGSCVCKSQTRINLNLMISRREGLRFLHSGLKISIKSELHIALSEMSHLKSLSLFYELFCGFQVDNSLI